MHVPTPYLVFLGDLTDAHYAKTGLGLKDWVPDRCVAQLRLPGATVDAGLPDMSPAEAKAAGARSLVIGVANRGGHVPEYWLDVLVEALEAGLDLVSGLHTRLEAFPVIAEAVERTGRQVHNVRFAQDLYPVADGEPRAGHRVLTVGTDTSIGKKYAALALTKALQERGVSADFRATGQTGILIAGRGVPMDALKGDFIAGAAEWLTPAAEPDHWDIVEGQGSFYHPSYAAVTLGLLHGAQPDFLVMCHDPTRAHVDNFPRYAIPPLNEAIDLYLSMSRITSPNVRCAGISLNTSKLNDAEAHAALAEYESRYGYVCIDPLRTGAGRLADALIC